MGLIGAVAEEWLVHDDCPLWGTDPWEQRPTVRTPHPRIVLAGDGIRCNFPVALMERAATTGFLAANQLLSIYIVTILGQSEAVPAAVHGAIDHRALIQQRAEVRTRTRPSDQLPSGVAPEHDLAASNDARHRLRTPDELGAGAARSASGLAGAAQ
jgi:hypothetical protein